jgi:hypothetical protein
MSTRSSDNPGLGTILGWVAVAALAIMALTWAFQGNDFFLYKAFAPKYEEVRRQTFEESKAYNQGMIQELQNMQIQYGQANDAQKATLAGVILHRTADFNMDDPRVPATLRDFVKELKRERGLVR